MAFTIHLMTLAKLSSPFSPFSPNLSMKCEIVLNLSMKSEIVPEGLRAVGNWSKRRSRAALSCRQRTAMRIPFLLIALCLYRSLYLWFGSSYNEVVHIPIVYNYCCVISPHLFRKHNTYFGIAIMCATCPLAMCKISNCAKHASMK